MNDLRFAIRQLLKNPGATVAVLTLGICSNTLGADEPNAATAGDRVELIDIGASTARRLREMLFKERQRAVPS
jgi:hypothetical protein